MAVVVRPYSTQTVVFTQAEYSSLLALLSGLRSEEVVRKVSRENSIGLGSNQVEEIARLWEGLALNEVEAK
jgi:hypothetical protein